jgi:sugar-specific transcriptional regulator TrmB
MIVQKNLLNKLKDLGLNSYESKLWTALLSRGISTAGELSDIANVPRSRTYDVLESLEKKGFIIMKIGKPIKYIAVPPTEVIDRVKRQIKEDASTNMSILDELKGSEVLNELNLLHSQGVDVIEPTELSGALKGRKNFYNHIESLINSAQKSIVIMTTEKGLMRKMNSLKTPLHKAHKRGVDIRIAADVSKKSLESMKEITSIAKIKPISDVRGRFVIADGKDIAFAVQDGEEIHPSYDVGIWVSTPFFATAMHSMFDHIWKSSR